MKIKLKELHAYTHQVESDGESPKESERNSEQGKLKILDGNESSELLHSWSLCSKFRLRNQIFIKLVTPKRVTSGVAPNQIFITPKRVTSGGIHLCLAPGQHSSDGVLEYSFSQYSNLKVLGLGLKISRVHEYFDIFSPRCHDPGFI